MQEIDRNRGARDECDRLMTVSISRFFRDRKLWDLLFNEVLPAVRFNLLMLPAPEWAGFDKEWLRDRILKKHRFDRRRPLWFQLYTRYHWRKLRPAIAAEDIC